MLRGPIEEKIKEKTIGRDTMKVFLENILKLEEAGKHFKTEYKTGIKNAVNKEKQLEG